MRLIIMLGCLVATSAGCDTTRCMTHCTPCSKPAPSPCPPGTPITPGKPTSPTHLPPTIREVRGGEDVSEPRAVAANQDVLLIPRWVYVPYSPHMPTGPSKLPGGAWNNQAMGPYLQADDRVTVLPPMGGSPASLSNETMEQCLLQMKMLNARINELETKNASCPAVSAPAMPVVPASMPQMLPLPMPVIPIPPAN